MIGTVANASKDSAIIKASIKVAAADASKGRVEKQTTLDGASTHASKDSAINKASIKVAAARKIIVGDAVNASKGRAAKHTSIGGSTAHANKFVATVCTKSG